MCAALVVSQMDCQLNISTYVDAPPAYNQTPRPLAFTIQNLAFPGGNKVKCKISALQLSVQARFDGVHNQPDSQHAVWAPFEWNHFGCYFLFSSNCLLENFSLHSTLRILFAKVCCNLPYHFITVKIEIYNK